jgi:peptidoglycan/xylan/chitin deacetylase (PgdA/CDA1 family)
MTAKVRRFLHLAAANLLHYSGLLRVRQAVRRRAARGGGVSVLVLHRVLGREGNHSSNSLEGMVLREETFVQILEHLRRRYRFVSLDALLTPNPMSDPRPCCLMTFDDGWEDNHSVAFQWLKKYQVPAAIFVTTGMVGKSGGFWVERLVADWKDPVKREQIWSRFRSVDPKGKSTPGLEEIVETCKRMSAQNRCGLLASLGLSNEAPKIESPADPMLSWEQVKEMNLACVDFGSHTVTHPLLTYEEDSAVERELVESKQALESALGKEVKAFAFPNGDWNDRVRKKVQEAGYRLAFTARRGEYSLGEDAFTIPRINLHEGNVTGWKGRFSPAMLELRLSGWY